MRGNPLELTREERRAIDDYFNPPLYALFYAPLQGLAPAEIKTAATIVSLMALALMIVTVSAWHADRRFGLIVLLAVASYWPLYHSIIVGQPSTVFALLTALSLTALLDGRMKLAGLLASTLVLKPSFVITPGLTMLRHRPHAAIVAAIIGTALLFTPFLLPDGPSLTSWLNLLSQVSDDALRYEDGGVSVGAFRMFSWNGFWGRLLVGDPPLALVLPSIVITLPLAARVIWRGSIVEGWFAGTLATLICAPHSHPQDFVILLPVAFALAIYKPGMSTVVALVSLHFAINLSEYYHLRVDRDTPGLYLAPVAGLLVLAWLAFEGDIRSWQARRGAEAVPAGA